MIDRTMRVFCMAILLIVASVFLTECNKKDEDLDVSLNLTEENFCEEVAQVKCHNTFKCCTGREIEMEFGSEISTSEKDCRRDVTVRCEKASSELLHAFNKRTVSLSLQPAQLCLEKLIAPEDTCFPYISTPTFVEACMKDLIRGKQNPGQICLFSFECVGDGYCAKDRTCRALPKKGESCASGRICAAGNFCEMDPSTFERICKAQKGKNEKCNTSMECKDDFYCKLDELDIDPDPDIDTDTDTDTDMDEDDIYYRGKCTARKNIGDSCDHDMVCKSGKCLPGMCDDGERTCYENEDCYGNCQGSESDECYFDEDCNGFCEGASYDYCQDNSDCDGVCESSGDSCYNEEDCPGNCSITDDYCEDNYDCDFTTDDDTCEHKACIPDECIHQNCEGMGNCMGTPVCAERYETIDYCELEPLEILGVTIIEPDDDDEWFDTDD